MSEESDYIEVKVHSKGMYKSTAEKIVKQGASGAISGSQISPSAKKVLEDNGVWYRENVEPSDLESESREIEKEN